MEIIWNDSFLYVSIHVISTIRYTTMACSPDRVLRPVIAKVKVQFPIKPNFFGSLYISGKLLTYPSPKPTFLPKWWEVSLILAWGGGRGGGGGVSDPIFSGSLSTTSKGCLFKCEDHVHFHDVFCLIRIFIQEVLFVRQLKWRWRIFLNFELGTWILGHNNYVITLGATIEWMNVRH